MHIYIQVTLKHFGRHCGLVVRALAPVVQKINSAIHRINLYPGDNVIGFSNTYPVNSAIQLLNNRALDSVSSVTPMPTRTHDVCVPHLQIENVDPHQTNPQKARKVRF